MSSTRNPGTGDMSQATISYQYTNVQNKASINEEIELSFLAGAFLITVHRTTILQYDVIKILQMCVYRPLVNDAKSTKIQQQKHSN